MIVERRWSTQKSRTLSKAFKYRGNYYTSTSKEWVGYFLFGIIPLYIKNVGTYYN